MATFILRSDILKEHSKAQCTRIVKWVASDQQRFDELFKLFLNDEYRVVQRAAWPVSYCVIAHPLLITRHWDELIKNMEKPGLHEAVKRNSLKLLEDITIPEKYHGAIMNICFNSLESPTTTLAVKVYAMAVLGKLAGSYPEIIPELKLLIEDHLPHQTAGFKSRAKKVLKQISQISP